MADNSAETRRQINKCTEFKCCLCVDNKYVLINKISQNQNTKRVPNKRTILSHAVRTNWCILTVSSIQTFSTHVPSVSLPKITVLTLET